EVDVDVLEHEQASVSHANESRELARVGLGEDLRDLALAVRLDLGDDDGPLDHGGSWRILDAHPSNRTLARHSCPPETRHVWILGWRANERSSRAARAASAAQLRSASRARASRWRRATARRATTSHASPRSSMRSATTATSRKST